MHMRIHPPENMTELYQRCAGITGLTLGELARELNIKSLKIYAVLKAGVDSYSN